MALSAGGSRGISHVGCPISPWLPLAWGSIRALRPFSSDSPPPGNVVRIPRKWQQRLERLAAQQSHGAGDAPPPAPRVPRAGQLLLRSRRHELSQGSGQTVGRFERPRLVSAGWKHRFSRGDYFQLERLRQKSPQEQEPDCSPSSFLDLGVDPALASTLQDALSIAVPTAVQTRVIPVLLNGRNSLCAAETGSGKTLAYLLPLIQRLLKSPELPCRVSKALAPRSLVVLPSRELSGQVRSTASYLCTPHNLQVREIGGGRGMHAVWRKIRAGHADLLVATPGVLFRALRLKMLSLERLLCLVLDEVDTLLDPTFVDLVEDVLHHAFLSSNLKEVADAWDPQTQLVAVGATLPKGLGSLLSKVTNLDSFSILTSKSLHRLLPHIEQKFMRIKGADKVAELLQLIKNQKPSSGAVLIFCNNASTVNWLSYILDDHKIKHLRLQGQIPALKRTGIFETFQKGQCDVLVCSDIASRGLDTTRVQLVINYDFPFTLHDYLHRAGRVGRTGSKFLGTVVSFVTHKWDVDLVRKIETAARKRTPLPGMEPVVAAALLQKKKS